MKKLGIIKDDIFLKHSNGPGHPECPERLENIYKSLEISGLMNNLILLDFNKATEDQIISVHTKPYYDLIKSTSGIEFTQLDADTSACEVSFKAALKGSGGLITSVDSILKNDIESSFVFCRPPGHHAEKDRAMGFCLFNHIAVGAAHLLNKHKLERILIIDWDVHHGNGTQNIFFDSDKVLYFSVHQFPYYPGTGSLKELGYDKGLGYTFNVPVPSMLGDNDYLRIFTELLQPVVRQYKPEFILISAGFDAYFIDPLGGMNLTIEGFSKLTRFVLDLSDEVCDGNIAFLLEGGYNIAEMGPIINNVIEEILDLKNSGTDFDINNTNCAHTIDTVKEAYSRFWKF
ncbi:MAG: histone deacetylase [Candidatus Dadabacteria bacterium]|nr:histone deacetylase [Candidatus Dadabacteria bacterium]NIQ14329.1 histone deacetylase [Candidatus Dadabacteria bacterium]